MSDLMDLMAKSKGNTVAAQGAQKTGFCGRVRAWVRPFRLFATCVHPAGPEHLSAASAPCRGILMLNNCTHCESLAHNASGHVLWLGAVQRIFCRSVAFRPQKENTPSQVAEF